MLTITLTTHNADPLSPALADATRGLHNQTISELDATIIAPSSAGGKDLLDRLASRLTYLPV